MGAKERREREKEQRKNQILDAARTLLLERGLSATSINQIAKRAELSVGAIYFYYRNKEELFAALQVEGLGLLSRTIRRAASVKAAPDEKIRNIAQAYWRFSDKQKNYFDVVNYFLSSPEPIFSPDLKKQVDERGNESLLILADVIAAGVRDGVFRNLDPKRQAIVLWGALHGMIQLKKLDKTILSAENHHSLYREAVERFLDALRRPEQEAVPPAPAAP
jgi:AcrR family transcriptional regulator